MRGKNLKIQNELREFRIECLINTIGSKVTKRELYNHYIKWVEKNGYGAETINVFSRYIQDHAPFMIEKQLNNGRTRYWMNVELQK